MVEYRYNEPYYKLHFSQLEEDVLKVLSFEGQEKISTLFEFRFELLSENSEIDASVILNKKATFILTRGTEDPIKIHGIISYFEQRGKTPDYVSYYAVLVPKMWRLTLTYQSEIYQNMDIKNIVTKVLLAEGFSGQDYEFTFNESYPELEYVVQYHETNFNFINRRLEHYGIFYHFEFRNDNDVIVFTDSNNPLPKINQSEDIYFNPNRDPLSEKETISDITCQQKVVTGLVRLKDYNYRFPERQLRVESQIDGQAPGMYYEYGDHFQDDKEGNFLAKIRNEEIVCSSKIFKGRGDCRLFRAGFKFKMGQHYRVEWNNTEYILTKVYSEGSQRGLFGILPPASEIIPTFENRFEAIPIDINYRPPRTTPIPKLYGIMNAVTQADDGDEYANIDEDGRYRLKMPFDLSEKKGDEASQPVRLATPHAGEGYGMHFPQHGGVEAAWACIDGNVDRPITLGTVPNPFNASPSTKPNRPQNVIRTAALNELTFDDTKDSENVLLKATKDNTITVANDQNVSVGANKSVTVGKNSMVKIDGTHTEQIKGDTKITITTGKYNHEVAAGTAGYHIKGSLKEDYDSDQTTIVKNSQVTKVTNKITITSENAEIHLDAGKEIKLLTGDSQLLMEKNGTIQLSGKTITISGKNINLIGEADVKISAPEVATTGTKEVTIGVGSSNVTTNTQGVTTGGAKITSAAVGVHELSGALIKIN